MFEGSTEPVQLRSKLVCSEPIDRVKVVQKNKGIGWREGSCLNVLSIPCIFQTNSNANLHHSFSTLLFFILNPFPSPSHPLWRSGSHPPPPPPPPVLLSRNHLQTLPPSPFPSPSLLFVPKPTLSKSQRNKSIAYHLRRMPTSPSSTRTTSTVDAKAHASPTSLGSSLSLLPSASPLALLLLCSTLL